MQEETGFHGSPKDYILFYIGEQANQHTKPTAVVEPTHDRPSFSILNIDR